MPLAGLICAGLFLAAVLGLLVFNLRLVATRKRAAALPAGVVAKVLDALDAAGSVPVLLRPAEVGASRLGGLPRVSAWPGEAIHLAEIDGVSVFAAEDHVLALRAEAQAPLPAPSGVHVLREQALQPVRLPGTWQPKELLEKLPALRELLSGHGDAPERLLAHVLMPGAGTHELSTEHLVLMGGEPSLIQNEHDGRCPDCGADQRFLFQVGAVFGAELELGDGAVVYVYSCDSHPARLSAFIDSH